MSKQVAWSTTLFVYGARLLHGLLMKQCGTMKKMSTRHKLLTQWQSLTIVQLATCSALDMSTTRIEDTLC